MRYITNAYQLELIGKLTTLYMPKRSNAFTFGLLAVMKGIKKQDE